MSPVSAPKFYNTFSLSMNDSHDFVVIEGHNFPSANDLEMKLYTEMKKQQLIKKQIVKNFEQELNETCSHENISDANKIIKYYKNKKQKNKTVSQESLNDEDRKSVV